MPLLWSFYFDFGLSVGSFIQPLCECTRILMWLFVGKRKNCCLFAFCFISLLLPMEVLWSCKFNVSTNYYRRHCYFTQLSVYIKCTKKAPGNGFEMKDRG